MIDDRDHQLSELNQRWIRAELDADSATLDGLSTDDFTLVGPLGFVLDKQQWLERYRSGDLVTTALDLDETATRVYPGALVAVSRLTQSASHRGRPADGTFRVTQIAVDIDQQLRLAGLHYSPIAPPPSPRG